MQSDFFISVVFYYISCFSDSTYSKVFPNDACPAALGSSEKSALLTQRIWAKFVAGPWCFSPYAACLRQVLWERGENDEKRFLDVFRGEVDKKAFFPG